MSRHADAESRCLAERILDTVPIADLAFAKLLGLIEIRADRGVRTACVTAGGRSRLLINPDFVRETCTTDRMLTMLALHELHHVLLGHTRLHDGLSLLKNIVFDAVINASLCRAQPDPEGTALFRSMYAPDRFPEALLRPPVGWPSNPRWLLLGPAREAHKALYSTLSATYVELISLFECASAGAVLDFDAERLLGDHDRLADRAAGFDPNPLEVVRRLADQWPGLRAGHAWRKGLELERRNLTPRQARAAAINRIRSALIAAAGIATGSWGTAVSIGQGASCLLPFRTLRDRRAEVRAALGGDPLLFRSETRAPVIDRPRRAHLYLDVSGSMSQVMPLVYGALRPLIGSIHDPVHLFSTVVSDIDLAELRRGVVVTDSGTDIACVTGHMVAHGVRSATILTDGWVGRVPEEHRRKLIGNGVRISVAALSGGATEFAARLGARVFKLPPLVNARQDPPLRVYNGSGEDRDGTGRCHRP